MFAIVEPYTEYTLQVAAYTKAGSSERSDPYPGLTDVKGQLGSQIDSHGLVQDCSNSIANALELLQSCTKPSIP